MKKYKEIYIFIIKIIIIIKKKKNNKKLCLKNYY